MKFKCVPNNNILNTYRDANTNPANNENSYKQTINGNMTQVSLTADTNNIPLTKLITANKFGNSSVTGTTLQCDTVYPNYLYHVNKTDKDIKDTPNALACQYAKKCGIPWTSQCGN